VVLAPPCGVIVPTTCLDLVHFVFGLQIWIIPVRDSTRAPVMESTPANRRCSSPLCATPVPDLLAAWSSLICFLLLCRLGLNPNPSTPVFLTMLASITDHEINCTPCQGFHRWRHPFLFFYCRGSSRSGHHEWSDALWWPGQPPKVDLWPWGIGHTECWQQQPELRRPGWSWWWWLHS
jgi:hypothetical protein